MTSKKRARGAALMTALFVVALAALLVSGLLWRQHVQIRRLENQRLMMQARWVERSALDWIRLTLRALGAAASVDYLGGVWAVPLAPTHLSDVLGRAGDAVRAQAGEDTDLSGWVEDAQAKSNLRNLVGASASGQWQPDIVQIKNFQRLLPILKLEPELANAAAAHLRAALAGLHPPEAQTEPNDEAEDANPSTQPLFLDDLAMLLDVPGFSREVIARLAPFVTVLPQRSAVNVNTARAEVIAALFEGLGLANAQTLAEQREQIFFVHTADFVNRARAISGAPLPLNANAQQFDVKTRFLIIHGRIRHGRVQLARDAWVYRDRAARKARIVRVRDAECVTVMTTLIVQLPPRNTAIQAAQWQLGALPFALFDRRARMLRAGCATLTLLPRAQTTILLIAARDLLLLSVPLAPLSKARLRAVLPNVVEDQLAQDAQSCHIALEPMPARQSASRPKPACTRRLAIIDRDWFRFIHMAFTEAGHLRLRAAPITSCLPDAEADSETPAWRVLAYDSAPQDSGPPLIELALARGAHAEGLSVSADALAVSLAAVIMDAPAALYQLNRAPAHALEHFSVDLPLARARRQYGDRCGRSRFRRAQRDGCDPAAIPNAENAEATQGKSLKNALAALPASLKTYPLSFETLARAALKCRFDLCQFEFAAPLWHIPRGALKRWRAPLILLAASALTAISGANLHWMLLALQLNALRAQQTEGLLSAFPGTTSMLDAPRQMALQLDRLRIHAGEPAPDDFLSLAQGLARALGAVQERSIEQLDYRDRTLEVSFKANVKPDAAFQRRLADNGLSSRFEGGKWILSAAKRE